MSGTSTIKICCCYSRADEKDLRELKDHLRPLESQGLITVWSDENIKVGEDWEKAIEEHLKTAHIILLLISPKFISSDYCSHKEMIRAMERYEKKQAYIIPINLRKISRPILETLPFGKLQAITAKVIPSTRGKTRDAAFAEVAGHIYEIVTRLRTKMQTIFEDAERYFGVGKYHEALTRYQELVSLDVQHQEAFLKKAQTLLKLDRPGECLACLEQAPKLDTPLVSISFYECYARVYEILERNEDSLAAYDNAIHKCNEILHMFHDEHKRKYTKEHQTDESHQKVPLIERKAYLLERKARLHFSMQKYDEALHSYEQAGDLCPQEAIYAVTGEIQCQLGQYALAIKAYEKAISLGEKEEPPNPSTMGLYYHKIGTICLQQTDFQAALESFEQAITYERQDLYLLEKGKCLLKLERYSDAQDIFEQCILMRQQCETSVHRHDIDFHIYYGHSQALFHLRELELSLTSLNKAIDITYPDTPFELYNIKKSIHIDLSVLAEAQAEEARKKGYFLEQVPPHTQDRQQQSELNGGSSQHEALNTPEKKRPDTGEDMLTPEESFYIPILQILSQKSRPNKRTKMNSLREGLSTSEIQQELMRIMYLSRLDLMPVDKHNPNFQKLWEVIVTKAYYSMAARQWIELERNTNTWKISEQGRRYLESEQGVPLSIQPHQQGGKKADIMKDRDQQLFKKQPGSTGFFSFKWPLSQKNELSVSEHQGRPK